MKRQEKRLGAILCEKDMLKEEHLKIALEEQKSTREFLGDILLKRGYVKEGDLLKAISEQFGISTISLKGIYIDWNLVKRFRPSVILDNKCFPVKEDGSSVTVAMLNPLDAWALKIAEEACGRLQAKFVLVSSGDMDEIITRYKQFIKNNMSGTL